MPYPYRKKKREMIIDEWSIVIHQTKSTESSLEDHIIAGPMTLGFEQVISRS